MARILVVDDRPLNRELLRTLLQYQSHQIIEASEGAEALVLAREQKPDLIITDILMPTMDGYEFVHSLRADPLLAESLVIFYTASYKNREALAMARACQVDYLLFKPCEPEEILTTVAKALASRPEPEIPPERLTLLASTSFRLTALTELCLDLSAECEPETLLNKFCHSARELVKASCTVWVDKERPVVLCACEGEVAPEDLMPASWSLATQNLFQGRELFRACEPESLDLVLPVPLLPLRNAIGVSLRSRHETYGWLCCFNKDSPGGFDDQDQHLLLTLAAQVGQTYENSLMYARLEQQNQDLRVAQQGLQASQQRMQLAQASAGIGIWELDLRTHDLVWDERLQQIYGYGPGEFNGQFSQWQARVHPDDFSAMMSGASALQDEVAFCNQHRVLLPGGEIRIVESTGQMIFDAQGQPARLVGIGIDITERKLAERELAASRDAIAASHRQLEELVTQLRQLALRAEAANYAKSEFLNNMSHELRTPLNGVMGGIQLLKASELTHEQAGFADLVYQSGASLLELIEGVLNFTRIENDRIESEPEPFSLSELLTSVFARIGSEMHRKQLRLQRQIDETIPDRLLGNVGGLSQILYQLLANAVKFTPAGAVSLLIGRCNDRTEGVRLRFEIHDTGIGIAPEAQKRIFEPLTQLDSSLTRRFGGMGMGLSLAAQLAEQMGGRIDCVSHPGAGSCFSFELDFAEAALLPVASEQVLSVETKALTGPRILLVEDNQINQIVTLAILSKFGYGGDLAADGSEALKCLKQVDYDLVLMDCQMPIMDGYEVTRRIRQGEAGSRTDLPIIAVTAHVSEADRQHCLMAGMDDYLAKPFSPEELAQMLERWLGRS
ncbi:MAG: response regulator [Candidatus Sericytochromatia bacterium]